MHTVLVDQLCDDAYLPQVPHRLMRIAVMEIAVADESGRYLLLVPSIYPPEDAGPSDRPCEAYLTRPYLSYVVDHDELPQPMSARLVRALFEEGEDIEGMGRDVLRHARQLGLGHVRVEHVGCQIELKPSLRANQLMMCLKFYRFRVWTEDDVGLRNLADPEGLHGFVHLPLIDLERMVTRRGGAENGCKDWWFRGKPIASDVQAILSKERRGALSNQTVRLRPEHFWREEEGLIVVADLAGCGKGLQHAKEAMFGIGFSGDEMAAQLLSTIAHVYHRLLTELGASQESLAGDGFIAAFPKRVFDPSGVVRRLLPSWCNLIQQLERLNGYMRERDAIMGSRLALHYGPYWYGRIGQSLSRGPALHGMSIVEAARLEQGLARSLKESDAADGAPSYGEADRRHALAVSESALAYCHAALDSASIRLEPEGRLLLAAKESRQYAHVWRFNAGA